MSKSIMVASRRRQAWASVGRCGWSRRRRRATVGANFWPESSGRSTRKRHPRSTGSPSVGAARLLRRDRRCACFSWALARAYRRFSATTFFGDKSELTMTFGESLKSRRSR